MVDNSENGESRMSPVLTGTETTSKAPPPFSWATIGWVSALLAICYAPVLIKLVNQWTFDPDMGHGFFVPAIAAGIVWHKRGQIAGKVPKPNWWGLALMIWAGLQLYIATLGAELFLSRTSFVISII